MLLKLCLTLRMSLMCGFVIEFDFEHLVMVVFEFEILDEEAL